MKNIARALALAAFAAVLAFTAVADDGMWMPHQMKTLDLKALGLRMDPGDLYKTDGTGLMSAVVNLGGGTGEFVSAEGLVLTNHHVAYGAIQRASSKESDYITDGFLARERAEEIPAQGYTAGVLLGYEDVTAKVNAYFKPGMTPRQRYDAFEKAQKEIVAAAEKGGKDLRCTLASMYSGNAYYLYTFKQIRDVRLVYAPPQDLGNFGGETDNWMWPRHTCDFSFLRAYVAPDGTAADFSPSNVPYKPKVWLRLSVDGFKEGDFTFVMGYPGRTYRNYALAELKADQENMAQRIKDTQELISFYEAAGKADKEVEIRYAGLVKGLYNGLKNRQGKLLLLQREEGHLLLHGRRADRFPPAGQGPGQGSAHAHRDAPGRRPRRGQDDRRARRLRPLPLLLELHDDLRAGHHPEGPQAADRHQPDQDLGAVRTADVLPGLRGADAGADVLPDRGTPDRRLNSKERRRADPDQRRRNLARSRRHRDAGGWTCPSPSAAPCRTPSFLRIWTISLCWSSLAKQCGQMK